LLKVEPHLSILVVLVHKDFHKLAQVKHLVVGATIVVLVEQMALLLTTDKCREALAEVAEAVELRVLLVLAVAVEVKKPLVHQAVMVK
jgi:hypothetical protein